MPAYTQKENINDSNYKQAKNKTLSNNTQLYVNSNKYTVTARTYICMFSLKKMYAD